MSTATPVEAVDLEALFEHDEPQKCEARPFTHETSACTVIARWRFYNDPECSFDGRTSGLWCDAKRLDYLEAVRRGRRCVCGRVVGTHGTVVPL